jgi:hypothetical protein
VRGHAACATIQARTASADAQRCQQVDVGFAAGADDIGAAQPGQLGGVDPDAACRAGHHDGFTGLGVDRGNRRPRSGPGSGDRRRRLPRQPGGFGRDRIHAERNVFGLRCPRREAEDLVFDHEIVDTGTNLGDISREVIALSLGEVGRPDGGEVSFSDTDFTRIGGRCHHSHHDLPGSGGRAGDLDDVEDVRPAIPGELHRPHHNCPGCA